MAAFGEDGTAAPIVRACMEGLHHAGGILGRQVRLSAACMESVPKMPRVFVFGYITSSPLIFSAGFGIVRV